jgi:UDP-N-acetylglucosamine diphosphorylase/glucosamine-1-phosphate N-acetyltransferase
MNIVLFEDSNDRLNLLPFTFTRPVAEIRCGITKLSEKWRFFTDAIIGYTTDKYLSSKFPAMNASDIFFINGALCADKELFTAIEMLESGEALYHGQYCLAYRGSSDMVSSDYKQKEYDLPYLSIRNLWDIFTLNDTILKSDFELITKNKTSENISNTNIIIGDSSLIFAEPGAKVEASVLNTTNGPIYLGVDSEIMEGCLVRGSLALCDHAQIKMGAKIYGSCTFGPECRVGGEVNNSVLFGFSNKGHDGFLGNSVLGEWCNLGADSNNSNLKNNYAQVKLWNYSRNGFVNTGLQFCGLFMGDHSKCGINTMFNTGTVVGVCANIFGSGFPRNFVPSFAWGGAQGFTEYRLKDAAEVAAKVMERRKLIFDSIEQDILSSVFEITASERNF